MAAPKKPKIPHNGGRPQEDDAFKKHEIILHLKRGLSWRKACVEAGTNIGSAANWRKRDRVFDEAVLGILNERGIHNAAPLVKDNCARTATMVQDTKERDQIIEEVCKGLAFGLELDFACMLASIEKRALRQWMSEDLSIMTKINRARAKNMAWWIEKIRKGAETDWRAAVVYLERMFPHLWAECKQIEITKRNEDPLDLRTIEIERSAVQSIKQMSNKELLEISEKHMKEI
jgi:hypothetical protein